METKRYLVTRNGKAVMEIVADSIYLAAAAVGVHVPAAWRDGSKPSAVEGNGYVVTELR